MMGLVAFARDLSTFLGRLFSNRRIFLTLAVADFRANYLGSFLSSIWAFIHPLITTGLLYFVFQVGFAAGPVEGHPFALWLIAGMLPWYFLAEAANSGTGSVVAYGYLVKKVVFMTSALPIIKIMASFFVHLAFLVIVVVIFLASGYRPMPCNIQILYYLFCMVALLVGLTWLTSALAVFTRDIVQLVAALTQVLMWATPIVWPAKALPLVWQPFLRFNPFHYIIQGYRDSLMFGVWFWEKPGDALCFWAITLFFLMAGAFVFSRMRPHFADIL